MPLFDAPRRLPSHAGPRSGDEPPSILTVSQLTAVIKDVLEGAFPAVAVSGEISNLSRPSSGHCYFTLKDSDAQLRAVAWRNTASRIRFDLRDGLEVICFGRLDLYPPRGSYQLVVEQMLPKGIGALALAFRQLRDKLAAEGIFDPARKRPLPKFPRRIAFVTSPTGAAIRDFLEVLRRRWRGADVSIIPVRVQGEGASREIAAGIEAANRLRPAPDVLVVGRGGGSMEDLWAFNEECVVRAIFASEVPVVSAVGHEIDVTLSDLVADVRALTPSEAAERVAPDAGELRTLLVRERRRMSAALRHRLALAATRLDQVANSRSFRRPLERAQLAARRIDDLEGRLTQAIQTRLSLAARSLESRAARLEALSPLAVLGRGYSLTRRADNGSVIRSVSAVRAGDRIVTRLVDGEIASQVQ